MMAWRDKAWLKDLDADFDNTWLTTKAEVTAECITELSASSVMGEKFARLIAGVKMGDFKNCVMR